MITVSLQTKPAQKTTDAVLAVLGWKLRRNKGQIGIESGEKSKGAAKQDLSSALAIDQAGMEKAFQTGKPFEIAIPSESADLLVDEALLRTVTPYDRLAGGRPEALARNADLAAVSLGRSSLDAETTKHLIAGIGIRPLAEKYALLFSFYGSAMNVRNGRVAVPPRFLRALFDQEHGKLLAFFFALTHLDIPHQRFLTLTQHRATAFYDKFRDSQEVQSGSDRLVRSGSFAEFLREIPLEEGHVAFPGSPEVRMVVKGESKSIGKTQEMLRKAQKMLRLTWKMRSRCGLPT